MVDSQFSVTSRREGRTEVLVLRGELDLASHRRLEQEVQTALESGPERLVLDLEKLEFMDVAGLRSVLRSESRAVSAGKPLVLAAPAPSILRLLAITHPEPEVSVFGSVAEAVGGG